MQVTDRPAHPPARAAKFRQAAFVYLHVTVLYEAAALVMVRHDILPTRFGPPVIWLVIGLAVGLAIFWGLLHWQNVWLARVVWLLNAYRTVPLIRSAFVPTEHPALDRGFYLTALVVVVINMWMLARAAWDV